MKRYIVRIMLVALMLSAHVVAKPVKIITDSGAYIWIESTLLSPILGETFIKSIENKGQFKVQVPDSILGSVSELFTLARSAYLTKSDKQDIHEQIYLYALNTYNLDRLEDVVELLEFVQQYFPADFQYGLSYGVGAVAKDAELDLSQTSISADNQLTIALAQRTLYPHEQSLASYLKTNGNKRKLLSEDKTTLKLVGLGLTSIAGIDQFPTTVKHIDLSHNTIDFDTVESTLLTQRFPKLETLSISHNVTKRLHSQLYTKAAELKQLHANGNLISQVEPDVLSDAPNLETVNLQDNLLENLPQTFLATAPKTTKLYLKGNPLLESFQKNIPDHLKQMMINTEDTQLRKRLPTDIKLLESASPSKKSK